MESHVWGSESSGKHGSEKYCCFNRHNQQEGEGLKRKPLIATSNTIFLRNYWDLIGGKKNQQFTGSYGNVHEYEKEKWIKEKNRFAGRFGINKIEIFQNQVHFHLKKWSLKEEIKALSRICFLSIQSIFISENLSRKKLVPFLQQVRERRALTRVFNCLQYQAFASGLIL